MRRLAGPVLTATAVLAIASGCASPQCTETATCPAGDGAADADGSTDGPTAADGPTGLDGSVDADMNVEAGGDAVMDSVTRDTMLPSDAPSDRTSGPDAADGAPPVDSAIPCNPSAPDCSNPQCTTGYACIPAAPAGWLGPVALDDKGGGPPRPQPDPCPASVFNDDVFDGFANPSSPALTCTCTCGGVTGSCTSGTIGIYSDTNCMNQCNTIGVPSSCTVASAPTCNTGGGSAKVTAVPQPTGVWSCSPGTTTTTTSWDWARVGRGCEITRSLSAGRCPANQVCADRSPLGFQPTLCVYKNQDTDCSTATGYTNVLKYYESATDGRTCGPGSCGCATPTTRTCALQGPAWFVSSSTCTSGAVSIDPTGPCSRATTGSQVNWVSDTTATTMSGSCTPSGSGSTNGSVTPNSASAITVCCQ